MLLLFHTSVAGERYSYRPGQQYDVPEREAQRFLAAGFASAPGETETATAPAHETAAVRHGQPNRPPRRRS